MMATSSTPSIWSTPSTSSTSSDVRRAVLSLGSNLGDRLAMLQGAVDAIAASPELTVLAVSPVYETDPVGGPDQPAFLNAVLVVETALPPKGLLASVQAVEDAFHRTRAVHWGPRTLDVDVVTVGDLRIDEPDLQLPHPRAHERAFVLVPWADVDPQAQLPGHGTVTDLVRAVSSTGVRPRPDLVLQVPR